ncbi:MAG: MopE-related protein, partial [Flavobacteriales bacterium]|nr:MopE-related protein [Flavobacteriales bacterium]
MSFRSKNNWALSNISKSLLLFLTVLSSMLVATNLSAQNLITVPFNNGFVGLSGGNNSATSCYYFSGTGGLGWTNVQFTQNSPTNIFVAQGNDIIGSVVITDALGVEHTIPGFIKWRAPSGQVTTMVFQPAAGASLALSTNSFNGSSSYTITASSYIGLTFNGQVLSISPVPGTVTGNAATSGLLDELNGYLASFISATVADVTYNEAAGSAVLTVTLSATSSSVITMSYTTSDISATASSDYTAVSGVLNFPVGSTSQTIVIPITNDTDVEVLETFEILLSDPVNVSISNGSGTVTIVDNDGGLTVTTSAATESCDGYIEFIVSGAPNTYLTLDLINGTAIGLGQDFGSSTANNLQINTGSSWADYSNYVVIPSSGYFSVRTPLVADFLSEPTENFQLKVTPVSSVIASFPVYDVNFQTINLSGWTLISGTNEQVNAVYRKTNAITIAGQAIDVRTTITARSNVGTSANNFVFDNDGTNAARFQPEINSTSAAGSYVDFEFRFYLSGTTTQVALENFYVTGVDVDGASASSTEFIELENISSYTVDNASQLTITPEFRPGFTRFYGIPSGLANITFENTATFIANYFEPISTLNMRAGYSSNVSSARLFSIAFGSSIGSFSTPNDTQDDAVIFTSAGILDTPVEICNGIDDDCDGNTDEGIPTVNYYFDEDSDGYGAGSVYTSCVNPGVGYVLISGDCNDNDPSVYTISTEICGNGIDEDCDGSDLACVVPGCTDVTACNYNASATVTDGSCTYASTWYLDADGDGYYVSTSVSCTSPGANYNTTGGINGDCNDNNASLNTVSTEICGNGIDEDCDGSDLACVVPGCTDVAACNYNASATITDGSCTYASTWYLDADGDGYYVSTSVSCTSPGANYNTTGGTSGDCNDNNAAVNTAATEVCNGIDDNCNGQIDEEPTLDCD